MEISVYYRSPDLRCALFGIIASRAHSSCVNDQVGQQLTTIDHETLTYLDAISNSSHSDSEIILVECE